jgi:hypothetical protein
LRAGVLALALVVVCGWPSDGRLFVTEDITVRGLERAPEWDGLHRTFSPNPDGHTIPFSEMLGISRPP